MVVYATGTPKTQAIIPQAVRRGIDQLLGEAAEAQEGGKGELRHFEDALLDALSVAEQDAGEPVPLAVVGHVVRDDDVRARDRWRADWGRATVWHSHLIV
jgi:hypothetical protein